MIKQVIAIVGLVVLLSLGAPLASAQEGTIRTDKQAEKQEKQTERVANRAERLKMNLDRVLGRVDQAVERLGTLMARVEARIVKFETTGRNVAEAKAKALPAKEAVNLAKTGATELHTKIEEILAGSALPKDKFAQIRPLIKAEVEKIKAAHQKIVAVISALKPAREIKSASSTPNAATPTSNY